MKPIRFSATRRNVPITTAWALITTAGNKPVGAAISLWSNGVKCLNYLGLEKQIAALGGQMDTMAYRDGFTGETMTEFSLRPVVEQTGQRPYPVSRAELQSMLMHELGLEHIRLGKRMVDIADDGDSVTATFADGSTATGDILMILDADLTMPPEELPKFYAVLAQGQAEFANGVRLVYPMDEKAMQFLNLCANNYLGLSSDPRVMAAAHAALDSHGYGMSSVRFICGTQDLHKQLEQTIARFLHVDDAILFAACFDANGAVFEPLFGEEDAIISDELNHASIIDGVRLSKAQRWRFKNNNLEDLERCLVEARAM